MAKSMLRISAVDWIAILAMAATLGLLAEGYASPFFGARAGRHDAEADLAAGQPRILLGGRRRGLEELFAVAEERLGADVRLTGCCPTTYRDAYRAAYHGRLAEEFRKTRPEFDLDSEIAAIEREADARYRRRLGNATGLGDVDRSEP